MFLPQGANGLHCTAAFCAAVACGSQTHGTAGTGIAWYVPGVGSAWHTCKSSPAGPKRWARRSRKLRSRESGGVTMDWTAQLPGTLGQSSKCKVQKVPRYNFRVSCSPRWTVPGAPTPKYYGQWATEINCFRARSIKIGALTDLKSPILVEGCAFREARQPPVKRDNIQRSRLGPT